MIRLILNTLKRENYAFYDPDSKITLRLDRMSAKVEKLTPAIERAIMAGNIIDVDKVSNIKISDAEENLQETLLRKLGIVRNLNKAEQEKIAQKEAVEEAKAAMKVEEKEEVVEEEAPKKKAKKKSAEK